MKKSKILEMYEQSTGISYKHQPLFVGDVYRGKMGVLGMVIAEEIDGQIKYLFHKTNTCKHKLPEDRAGLNDGEFVANVVQDEELMKLFIENKIIEDDNVEVKKEEKPMAEETKEVQQEPVKEVVKEVEKPAKTKKATKEVAKEPTMNIYQKINAVRKAWAETDVEKEGKGRAGGGAKYDYYKPQQIIDFCLAQELKLNLYSRFNILEDKCYYEVINLDNIEEKEMVMCPFDVPRKMAASEAQQNGAAITYYNRRLAMTLYKIEDNSRESVTVLSDADFTAVVEIPAPPIVPPAPVQTVVETVATVPPTVPPTDQVSDQVSDQVAETPSVTAVPPTVPPTVPQATETTPPWEEEKTVSEPKEVTPPTPAIPPVAETPKAPETVPPVAPPVATPPVQTPPPVADTPKKSIESLY